MSLFLRTLKDSQLINLGVLDSNHRRAILNKASGSADITDDFDNMLGDLDSVIKDLEMFSVVVSYLCGGWPTSVVGHSSLVCHER